ncbi:MAG: hypothetical protein WAK54_31070, partial [Bradyrhizobium sp.]
SVRSALFVMVLKLRRFKVGGLLVDDVLGEIEHTKRPDSNKRKAQKAFPVGAGCHEKLLAQQKLRIQNSVAGIVPAFK